MRRGAGSAGAAISIRQSAALAPPDHSPLDEVGEMLRAIGIALVEVSAPV